MMQDSSVENISLAYSIPLTDINVKSLNVFKALEIPIEHVDEYTNSLVNELIKKTVGLAKPQADFVIIDNPDFSTKGEMVLENECFAVQNIVGSAMLSSSAVALFVCTVGPAVESFSKQLQDKGLMLEGLIVDLIGSEIAEEAAEWIQKKIAGVVSNKKLNITNRYSPGYCGWPVSDQQKIFKLLGPHNCGVNLTDSSLMLPIKSVSGIIGIGKTVKNRPYTCSICDEGVCIYRDKR